VKAVRLAVFAAVVIGLLIAGFLATFVYTRYINPPLRPGLTEEDIPVLKDRAFFACQDEAWDVYGFSVRFDVDETRYDRSSHVVEMDVRVGGRPMECTAYFEWDAPLAIRSVFITRRE
jgi:hypothetical protein